MIPKCDQIYRVFQGRSWHCKLPKGHKGRHGTGMRSDDRGATGEMNKCVAALVDPILGLPRVIKQRVRCPHNRRHGFVLCRKHLAAARKHLPVPSALSNGGY